MSVATDGGDLVRITSRGLYCAVGDFHIDPWRPVERAVITHGHADHCRWGMGQYVTATPGLEVLRRRLGTEASLHGLAYGEVMDVNGVKVSLHPAGHLLGSAQVRVEHRGWVWVVTGDYKRSADPTCAAFEPLSCHGLITESTFGLPVYRWRPAAEVFAEIHAWWRENQAAGRTSVILSYALGKAQRVMAGLDPQIGPILLHGAVANLVPAYEQAGVNLPEHRYADAEAAKAHRGQALVIAPPSAAGTPWLRKFGKVSLAMVSGWMAIRGNRRRRSVDRGFVLSDHADWQGLLDTVRESGAERVGVTHGYTDVFVRYLQQQGLDAFPIATRFVGESEDEAVAEGEADGGVDRDAPRRESTRKTRAEPPAESRAKSQGESAEAMDPQGWLF